MHHLRSEHLVVSLLLVLAAAGCDGTGSSGDADVDADADTDVDADVDTDTDAPQEWTPPAHEPVNPVPLDLASVTEDAGLFPAGVMAGDPQPDAMLLWTFATDAADLRLKVWLPGLDVLPADQVDLLHDAPVTPSPQGFVHQWVDTVVPGRRHAYAFVQEAEAGQPTARSAIGTFVAAPPAGALVRVTVSGTHGTHQEEAPYPNLVKNAEVGPFTLYIHTGDAVYADGARTREQYHTFWLDNWQTAGFQAVLRDAVYLPVWDDHEVTNNYNPETIEPDHLQAAIDAFFDANPMSRFPDAPNRYWRSWRWGDTVEFFALDCRSERKPSSKATEHAEYISVAQMAWLQEALLASPAVFKVVLNSVPVMDMNPLIWATVSDRWQGYAAQRTELVDFLASEALTNVFFATGDYHMATMGRVDPPGGPGERIWEFMLGPGAQQNPLGDREAIVAELGEEFDPLPPDQFLFGYPGALLSYVDLDPLADPPTMTVRYLDATDGHLILRATVADGDVVERAP